LGRKPGAWLCLFWWKQQWKGFAITPHVTDCYLEANMVMILTLLHTNKLPKRKEESCSVISIVTAMNS
jgi:hypothetical protein